MGGGGDYGGCNDSDDSVLACLLADAVPSLSLNLPFTLTSTTVQTFETNKE